MTAQEKTDALMSIKTFVKFPCTNISTGNTQRAARENGGTVFVYAQGRRKYGRRYTTAYFLENYNLKVPKEKDANEEWHKRLKKAIKCMENSGLWPDIKKDFENLLLMSWEDNRAIDEIYWQKWNKPESEISALFKPYAEKYPFAFSTSTDGYLQLNTNYTWETSRCQLKSMYFGKWDNERVKKDIAKSIASGEKYSTGTIRVSYDVSFDYEPTKKAAWYSEEYRNCGNGHYYLAIDANTALFCEND